MGKANILVVDDEANILDSVRGILTDEGYDVETAGNGDDALKMLQEQHYDLVLLDIWRPGRRDGLHTLREMRRLNIGAEVVMISGHGSVDTAVRATKLGAFDFIEKPLSLAGMLETIETALRHAAATKSIASGGENPRYITGCPAMDEVREKMDAAAKESSPVLISGEPGSGKEYSARHIHSRSARHKDTFIKVACRRLAGASFDGLFGPAEEDPAQKGSRFSKLSGTVFLENPHLLDAALQKRLARLIPVSKNLPGLGFVAAVTVTPPAKSAPPMETSLAACFTGAAIALPPLRERRGAIDEFISHFIHDASEDFGKVGIRLSRKAQERIASYPWPGNVKELKNTIENVVMSCSAKQIEATDIPMGSSAEVSVAAGGFARKGVSAGGMRIPQKTVGKSVVLCGLGLHSGIKTGIILAPLPTNSGIIFGDISSGRQVKANIEYVESTEYATTLKFGAIGVRTIEHIMATLHMFGITNALLKVGDEVPIMDGSASQLCDLVESAGIVEQEGTLEPVVIKEPILIGEIGDQKKYLLAEPCDRLVVEYRMDYPPPVGQQRAVYDAAGGLAAFRSDIAPARTFGFVEQIKKFEKKGFAEGGKLSNVILIDDERVINTTLRFENEFSRHKVLDILGDIYLAGRPVVGKITGNMTGHTENVLLTRKINALIPEQTNAITAP